MNHPSPRNQVHQIINLIVNSGSDLTHLSLMFIKSLLNKNIRSSIPECNKVKDFMKVIEEQFIRSDKALASIQMKRFSSKTFDYSKNVREHIMEMKDMVAQLKPLEVEIF